MSKKGVTHDLATGLSKYVRGTESNIETKTDSDKNSKGLSQITPGPRTASKNAYFAISIRCGQAGSLPIPRAPGNFKNPYRRRCVEDAAPNSPGVLFKQVARKQPVKDPAGCIRGPPGDRPANDRAPRDSLSPILVNKYNGHRTVSKGAGRLPFGARADP